MTDRLSNLLQRFDLRARVLHSGSLRGVMHFDDAERVGHLHLVRRGSIGVTDGDARRIAIDEPSAVFYPKPLKHRIDAAARSDAEVVSANIAFGVGDENPILRGLPDLLVLPLAEIPALGPTQSLLFAEALGRRCGHAAVVGRLTEVLVVQLLRFAIERKIVDSGLLAGLADPRLAKALTSMHAQPAHAWTLDALADVATMSRSRFAAQFAEVVGMPAGEYLTQWRVGLAKTLLRRGRPVKQVALEVGYGGASTFGRAFTNVVGASPGAWVRRQNA